MISQLLQSDLGIYMTLFLTLGFQDYYIPNDRGGVGANGTIGRGTGNGEHFVYSRPAARAAPTYVYAAPPTSFQPAPAPIETAPAESASRTEPSLIEPAVIYPALVRRNPYLAYHRGWVHGYWDARLPGIRSRPTAATAGAGADAWSAPMAGLGLGLGWGLPAWMIGPMSYSWGYYRYDNPFYRGAPTPGEARPRFDDYSRPINVQNPPPTETLLFEALASFGAARDAFRREDFSRALQKTEESLRLMPDDPMLQQFRALCLFALGRYEDAAAPLHAVLAVGPGWDWRTMVSVYGKRETYTRQLRLLEDAAEKPGAGAAAARFVLAYHYYTTGYADAALEQWGRVLGLQPDERVSAGLIRELQPARPRNGDQTARTPPIPGPSGSPAAASPSGKAGKLVGTWTANPAPDTTITLTFRPQGLIVWKVRQPGRDREFSGYAIYEQRILTLAMDQDNALVGTVSWQDEGRFTFKLLVSRPGDRGLTFAKSS